MQHELSNGVKVNLCNNFETAKFLLFKYPNMHVSFVGAVPHMTVNLKVRKLIEIRRRLEINRKVKEQRAAARQAARQEFIDADQLDAWDDDIPF